MRRAIAGLLFVFGAMLVPSGEAAAQGLVRYVASYGADSNPCTRTLPCRTLQRGHDLTPSGGELQILDSGEYGPRLRITKSMTISAVGVTARITNLSLNQTAIEISVIDGAVVLRGLLISGGDVGGTGIHAATKSLLIEDCVLERWQQNGIWASVSNLVIRNTYVRDNWTMGIYLLFGRYLIENSRIENNNAGIYMNGGDLTVVHTTLSGNVDGIIQQAGRSTIVDTTVSAKPGDGPEDHGFVVFGVVGTSEMTIERSLARGNTNAGALVASGGLLRMSNSVLSNNGTGIWNPDAIAETRGNNTVSGNGVDVDPPGSLTPVPPT